MHLHATYDSGLEGIYLIICSPIFVGVPCVKSSPISSLVSVSVGATLAPRPPECCKCVDGIDLVRGSRITSVGNFFSQCLAEQ